MIKAVVVKGKAKFGGWKGLNLLASQISQTLNFSDTLFLRVKVSLGKSNIFSRVWELTQGHFMVLFDTENLICFIFQIYDGF